MRIGGVLALVYLIVGAFIASKHHYFVNVDGVNEIVSAGLAVVLWPLVLLDVNLHIGRGNNGNKSAALAALWFARGLVTRDPRRSQASRSVRGVLFRAWAWSPSGTR
jgi:hypothetical protein